MWCIVVTALKRPPMKEKRSTGRRQKAQSKAAVRASISFPPDLYKTLEKIAQQKKVSLAWVVRDAAEKYIIDQLPLLAKEHRS
jgi:Ribbon-helix-helix protein, copG family